MLASDVVGDVLRWSRFPALPAGASAFSLVCKGLDEAGLEDTDLRDAYHRRV